MTSLIVSTIAYIIAAFLIKRWLDGMDIPKTMTRSLVIFVGAAVVSAPLIGSIPATPWFLASMYASTQKNS